jgi:membrane dipeptidase
MKEIRLGGINMNRRRFLQKSAVWGVSWACGGLIASCAQAPPRPAPDQAILRGLRIIDPHAHPDQFHSLRPSRIDDSSTLEKIRAVGMAASAFAAVGDQEFFSRSSAIPYYQSAKAQLQRVLDLGKAGKVKVVLKAADLPAFLNPGTPPGAILAIEGGDPLEGKPERVDEFYRMGVRIITVVHYRNNDLGDVMAPYGALNPGPYKNGLTHAGQKVIERMQEVGMVVDVAHAHSTTLKGIAEMTPKPLLDSHTNPCPFDDPRRCHRQRSWKDMELVAKTGGVVCTWPFSFNRPDQQRRTFQDWAREILEMKKRLGMKHVGLGTDGGGSIPRFIEGYRDVRDLPRLATAMGEIGLSPEDIKAYMGGNIYRMLQKGIG